MVVVGNALVTICYKRQIPTPRTKPGHTHSIFIAGIKTRKSKRNPSYTCVSCRRPNTYWVERSIAQRRLRRETEVVTFKMALMKTDSWGDQRVAGSQDPSLRGWGGIPGSQPPGNPSGAKQSEERRNSIIISNHHSMKPVSGPHCGIWVRKPFIMQ